MRGGKEALYEEAEVRNDDLLEKGLWVRRFTAARLVN